MKLSELLALEAPLAVTHRGKTINFTIRPEVITKNWQAEQAKVDEKNGDEAMILKACTGWDLTDDDEQPLPFNAETLGELSVGFRRAIAMALLRDQINPQSGQDSLNS
jgi:hypothetical protein